MVIFIGQREAVIRLWFEMWLKKEDLGIPRIFTQDAMLDGRTEAFDGMSLAKWSGGNRIACLQEFGCNEDRYDPYQDGPEPKFREGRAAWF